MKKIKNVIPGFELNRSVVIIRCQQPFLDWLNGLPDSSEKFSLSEVNGEPTAYLVPANELEFDTGYIKEWLEAYKSDLFERELEGWHTDPTFWPKNRTNKIFDKWFTIEIHTMVIDLVAEPLKRTLL